MKSCLRQFHWLTLFSFCFSYKAVSYKSAGYKSAATGYETKKTPIYDTNAKSEDGRRSYPSKYDYV